MGETQNKDDQDLNKPEVSAEELKSEEEALKETPDEEVRSGIVEEYELDEDADSDLIDKIVKSKKEGRKQLSTAIRQKIDWRTKAHAPKETKKEETKKEEDEEKTDDEKFDAKVEQKVSEKLEKNALNSLDVSDDLRKEIKSYAKINDCSIKEAFDSKYIKSQKEAEDKKKKAEDAAISGTHKTKPGKQDFSDMKPEDFDQSTEEGRKDWAEYKKWLKTQ